MKKTYSAAKDLILETSADIVQAATTETAKEFNRALAEQRQKIREKRFCKELTKKQHEGQGIDGATISDWFWRWKRDDLERLSSLAKRASVERMSLAQITRAAKGSIENNYSDGVFTESKVSAARMARTIVNGVSNNARVETIVQNSDAIDGVKFVGTLDGKTCPYCASYDGYIWRGEEIAEARRPPIHPNCRCCLIPYVELKDDEGNVVDVDGERPAANADFDKLAQDAYNERAREKDWKRRWDDLSPSTRLKYYYQAQKDFEERTGKPAYRQVSGATTFQEYFHRQPDSFKRAWLGAKRYELYKDGKLKEKNIFKPDLTYQVSADSLVRDGFRSVAQETVENVPDKTTKRQKAIIDDRNNSYVWGKTWRREKEDVGIEETDRENDFYSTNEANIEKRRREAFDKYFPAREESKNRAYIQTLVPTFKFLGKTEYNIIAKKGIREGLDAVARICDYYGIDVSEIGDLKFDREFKKRARFITADNKVELNKPENVDEDLTSNVIHEVGHSIEENCCSRQLKSEVIDFYNNVTLRDEKDGIQYELYEDDEDHCHFRILSIAIPNWYAAKEYVGLNGNVTNTEFISMFFQTLYERPNVREESDFQIFFNGIKTCIESAKQKASKNNGIKHL